MVKLVNSAMMPVPGRYEAREISFEEFVERLVEAYEKGNLESYIGYPQNIELIKEWTGIEVELNRSKTDLEPGDELLVMKLKYRVQDPKTKGNVVDENDFEFMHILYER